MLDVNTVSTDVLILGASASGLMCAIEAGKRQRKVVVLDHANKPGKKILMSGGGRCNFTNYHVSAENYISHNPHFCKSALSRYTQWDFIELVNRYQIPFHEREHGQLFCDHSARDILNMLLDECKSVQV
ncbi:MAG: NAD(P)/FAD-dependent oxidoreductase, partial [Thioalkalispiraceae bacterium]